MRPLLAVLILISLALGLWSHSAQADLSPHAHATAEGQAREPEAGLAGLLEDSESDDDALSATPSGLSQAHGLTGVQPGLFGRPSSPPRFLHPPQT